MTIRLVENFRALFYAPFYAAELTGAYAAEGVAVEHLGSDDPGRTAAALAEGAADVMWGGPLRAMRTLDRDPAAGVVCFADAVVRDPFFIIGAPPRPDFRLADLVGVRLATVAEVPTPWVCLQHDLRLAGIDPAKIERLDGSGMAENAASLREGRIPAVQLFQPYAEELLESGAGHLWYAAATRCPTAYTTFITRRDVLGSRRDELVRLARALHRALRWIGTVEAEEIGRALAPLFPSVPPRLIGPAIARYRALGLYAATPVIPREGVAWLHEAMRAGGVLSRDIPFEAVVDTSVAREAVGG